MRAVAEAAVAVDAAVLAVLDVRPELVLKQLPAAEDWLLVDLPSAVAALASAEDVVAVERTTVGPSAEPVAVASAAGSCRPWRLGIPCPFRPAAEQAFVAVAVGA